MNDDSGVGDDEYASGFDSSQIEQADLPPVFHSPAWAESPSKVRTEGIRARDSGVELMSSVENTPSKDRGDRYTLQQGHHTSNYPISASKAGSKMTRRPTRRHSSSIGGLEDQSTALRQRKKSKSLSKQSGFDASVADIAGLSSFDISTNDNPIPAFLKSLTSLPSESGLELHSRGFARTATRTASSITSSLQSFSTQISSMLPPPHLLGAEDTDALLENLSTLTPPPSQNDVSAAISRTTRSTNSLLDVLSSLSDTLHMSRETAVTASRRLQTTRELTTQARKELDQAETAQRWLEDNEQGQRIAGRESAKTCRELLAGFEAVCGGYRAQLVAGVAGNVSDAVGAGAV